MFAVTCTAHRRAVKRKETLERHLKKNLKNLNSKLRVTEPIGTFEVPLIRAIRPNRLNKEVKHIMVL